MKTNFNGGRLQQGYLVLPGELQEPGELLCKIHDLLNGHDGQFGEMGKPLLSHLSVLQVLILWPRLVESRHKNKTQHSNYISEMLTKETIKN